MPKVNIYSLGGSNSEHIQSWINKLVKDDHHIDWNIYDYRNIDINSDNLNIIVLRNPYATMNERINNDKYIFLPQCIEIWLNHANFINDNEISNNMSISIIYDKWLSDSEYRDNIIDKINNSQDDVILQYDNTLLLEIEISNNLYNYFTDPVFDDDKLNLINNNKIFNLFKKLFNVRGVYTISDNNLDMKSPFNSIWNIVRDNQHEYYKYNTELEIPHTALIEFDENFNITEMYIRYDKILHFFSRYI